MSVHYSRERLREVAAGAVEISPPHLRNRAERTFGLHPALYVLTIGSYFAFLAVMAAVFMNPYLVLPMAICIIYVVMAFGVSGLWARVAGRPSGRLQSWAEFRTEGVDIETGHLGSGAAIAQVLALPVLILGFGLAVAIIATAP